MALQVVEIRYDVDASQLDAATEAIREQARQLGISEDEALELNAAYKKQGTEVSKLSTQFNRQLGIIESLRKAERDLERARDQATSTEDIQKYNSELAETRSELQRLTGEADELGQSLRGAVNSGSGLSDIGNIAIGNIAADVFTSAIAGAQEYTQELIQIRSATETLLGVTGDSLDQIAARVQAVARVYDQDYREVLGAVNALQEEFGVSGQDGLEEINRLLNSGVNINGDFLDQIREYSTFFAQAEVGAGDFVDLLLAAEQAATFGDKAADSVKEFFLSVQEGSDSTRDAFAGIGINLADEVAKIQSGDGSLNDLLLLTSERLSGLDSLSPQVGAAIADIFRGAGQDAGGFVANLNEITTNLANAETNLTPFQELQNLLVEIQTQFGLVAGSISETLLPVVVFALNAFNDLITFVRDNGEEFAILATTILTAVTAQSAFTAATTLFAARAALLPRLLTLLQTGFRGLNTVLRANPIGLVVTAIGLLVLAIQQISENIEGAREAVNSFFNRLDAVSAQAGVFGNAFRSAFNGIRSAIGLVIDAIENFPATFTGVRAAFEAFVTNQIINFERFRAFFEVLGLEIRQAFTFNDEADQALQSQIDALNSRRDALAESGRSLGEAYTEARDQYLRDNPPEVPEIPDQEVNVNITPTISGGGASSAQAVVNEIRAVLNTASEDIGEFILNAEIEIDDDAEQSQAELNRLKEQELQTEAQISREAANTFALEQRAKQELQERLETARQLQQAFGAISTALGGVNTSGIDNLISTVTNNQANGLDSLDFSSFDAAGDSLGTIGGALGNSLDIANGLLDQFSQNRIERARNEAAALAEEERKLQENLRDAEESGNQARIRLARNRLEANQRLQEDADERIKELQLQQFRREKAAALAQASINVALAVAQALPNVAASILVGVLGGIQIAAIASTPAPFKTGVFNLNGKDSAFKLSGKGNATSDSIDARLSQNETVFSAKRTFENYEVFKRLDQGELLKPSEINGRIVYTFDKDLQQKQLEQVVPVFYQVSGYDSPELKAISQKVEVLERKSISLKEEIDRQENATIKTKKLQENLNRNRKELSKINSRIEYIKELGIYKAYEESEKIKNETNNLSSTKDEVNNILSIRVSSDFNAPTTNRISKSEAKDVRTEEQARVIAKAFDFNYERNAKAIAKAVVKEQTGAMWKDGNIMKDIWVQLVTLSNARD